LNGNVDSGPQPAPAGHAPQGARLRSLLSLPSASGKRHTHPGL
jgi:hypothetical protein